MADEQINALFQRYKQTKDVAIRNQIAEKYLYIADILAKKFVGRGVDFDDLKQVASLAIIRGIERFDPDLGMQFTTFITPTITGEIKNYFRDKSKVIKLPRRLSEIAMSVRNFTLEYEGKHGVKPSVKTLAEGLGIPVLQPQKLRDELDAVRALGGDIMITCAYGQLLTQDALDCFEKGVWNIHAGLLPAYRGASPIQSCILHGETQTGVSVMKTELGLDCGDVLCVERRKLRLAKRTESLKLGFRRSEQA